VAAGPQPSGVNGDTGRSQVPGGRLTAELPCRDALQRMMTTPELLIKQVQHLYGGQCLAVDLNVIENSAEG